MDQIKKLKILGVAFKKRLVRLSVRERVILAFLLILAAGYGSDFLFTHLYLENNRELKAAVITAEKQIRHHEQLLSRADLIHAQYQKIESPGAAIKDSVLTANEIIRELTDLAGKKVFVKNVVPRLGHHEGHKVMFVALDLEGSFEAVVIYLEDILSEMPSEVGSLSLSPWSGLGEGVMCRLSIRVECFES